MVKRIKDYIIYRIALHKIKRFTVPFLADLVTNYGTYVTGFEEILKVVKDTDSMEKILQVARNTDDLKEIQKSIIHEIAVIVHETSSEE